MINIKTYLAPKKNGVQVSNQASPSNNNAIIDYINDWFYYDAENNAVGCRYDFYSVGGVSANGVGDLEDNIVVVVDNLNSTDKDAALSANQGHELKEMTDDLQTDVDALKHSVVTLYYNVTDGVLATSTYSITFNEDMSQFKYLRCYFRPSLNDASDNNAIPGAVLEVNLSSEASTQSGEYAGSVYVGYINNDNRYASYSVMVSSDKTQFRVVRQTSLYGTAGTNISNATHGIYCYKIEGIK